MRVGILPNLDKRGSAEVVEKLSDIFKNEGIEAFLPENISVGDFKRLPENELYKTADLIITIGGDGTIIRYAKRAAYDNKPVLGINAGRVGYLANIEQNELSLLSKLKSGEYFVEKRMMLSVSVCENGKTIGEYNALNDAVITSGFISRIIDISVFLGRDSISYRADGLIISTPTGSTAYSMSAGGPILDPALKCFCVTPICSHSLLSRPVVFPDNSVIGVKNISRRERSLFLTLDGKVNCEIFFGDVVRITKSDLHAEFIHLKDQIFYKTLRQKMSEYN